MVGQFAGLDLLVGPTLGNDIQLILRGYAHHTIPLQPTALGTTRSLEHTVNHLEDATVSAEEGLRQDRKRLMDLNGQVDQPFEYCAKLAELAERQKALTNLLDLNRNAAPPGAESFGTA